MGIKGLFPFLSDNAKLCIKETKVEAMTGRTIAIDASMCLYQFLVAVRQGDSQTNLSNSAGEVTSHIQGFLSRTVRLLEAGVKPAYVFDGKPPELKSQTLANRAESKQQASATPLPTLNPNANPTLTRTLTRTLALTLALALVFASSRRRFRVMWRSAA